MKNAESLGAVTHTHTHTQDLCNLTLQSSGVFYAPKIKKNKAR